MTRAENGFGFVRKEVVARVAGAVLLSGASGHLPESVSAMNAQTPIVRAAEQEVRLPDTRDGTAIQYDTSFDRKLARELLGINKKDPMHVQKEQQFDSYIERQLVSMLGERLLLDMNSYACRLEGEKLVSEDFSTPLEDIIRVGIEHLRVHGRQVDRDREEAESIGFQKIQAEIAKDARQDRERGVDMGQVKDELTVIAPSPPGGEGSMYGDNFYDMFRRKRDGTIQVARFSSGLSIEETLERIAIIDAKASLPQDRTDVGLKSNPISVRVPFSIDEIHRMLHVDHPLLTRDRFLKIMDKVESLRGGYRDSLKADPENEDEHHIWLNALINATDIEASIEEDEESGYDYYADDDIFDLGMMAVRMAMTNCGPSGGFSVGGYGGPASVMDVGAMVLNSGTLGENTLNCVCPFCNTRVNAVISAGTITCTNDTCRKSALYSC